MRKVQLIFSPTCLPRNLDIFYWVIYSPTQVIWKAFYAFVSVSKLSMTGELEFYLRPCPWRKNSFVVVVVLTFWLQPTAYGILVSPPPPQPGVEPTPPALESGVLTGRPPGNPHCYCFAFNDGRGLSKFVCGGRSRRCRHSVESQMGREGNQGNLEQLQRADGLPTSGRGVRAGNFPSTTGGSFLSGSQSTPSSLSVSSWPLFLLTQSGMCFSRFILFIFGCTESSLLHKGLF